ncbi:MAG: hypothetical protein P4L85_19785 [Paludisphaera borealis]|uniref:hypothetical protein n=1 Tax=Paludisphaera borealis TaxID=1387353 RepID=UPI0028492BD5|nr:hypothetical protein [Paludisphaera borealis]MDR3621602.1 hypothetical protein [Paludisphaera borealis]
MSTLYTNNAKLGKPAVADRNWNLPLNANADALDALAPVGGLCVTTAEIPSASLNVQAAAGRFQKRDGTVGAFAGSALTTLPQNQTCSLYLTDAGTLVISTTGYPTTTHVRLATVVTSVTTILGLTDDRVVCGVVGTDSLPYLPLAGGTLVDGANVAFGTTAGTKIGTATTQKLGFWNATPIVRPGTYVQSYATNTRTLGAYTSTPASTAYTGVASGQTGTPYAQAADLNSLRAAYENLRVFSENTTQLLNALVNDLRAMGLLS